METFISIVVVLLIAIFHRPLSVLLGGLLALTAMGVVLVVMVVLVRSILFGS